MTHDALRSDETRAMDGEEYARHLAGHGAEVSEVKNPITRFTVKVDPPFKYHSEKQFESFYTDFSLWCEAMWKIGRMSPEEFKAERGWTAASPMWQLGRGEPAPTE